MNIYVANSERSRKSYTRWTDCADQDCNKDPACEQMHLFCVLQEMVLSELCMSPIRKGGLPSAMISLH